MATPFVPASLRIMLQHEPHADPPHADPDEIQQCMRITARRDAETWPVRNPGFGYGAIDVEGLLDF